MKISFNSPVFSISSSRLTHSAHFPYHPEENATFSTITKTREAIMKIQSIGIALTVINLVILVILLAQLKPAIAQQQPKIAPVLRGSALEIVDSLGRVRASITVQPAVIMNGKRYPQTSLLRLIDNRGGPNVKIGTSEEGSGMTFSDDKDGGLIMHARDEGTYIKLIHGKKEKTLEP